MYFGVCVTILVTASWVGATHCIKFLYIHTKTATNILPQYVTTNETNNQTIVFNAPFFASWFCTNFSILFFPIYLIGRLTIKKCESPGEILGDVLRGFRDRGLTAGKTFNKIIRKIVI